MAEDDASDGVGLASPREERATMRASWNPQEAREIIAEQAHREGALLPILHALQHRFGFIGDEAVALVADALNLSKAETLGVVAFYPDFRRAPIEAPVMKLCRAESCQATGCEDLVARLEGKHGIVVDQPGAALAVETVYCLGLCATSPAALYDGEPVGRLDSDRLDALVARAGGRR